MKCAWASKLLKDPPSRLDWLIFAVAAVGCYLVFSHGDIGLTGAVSLGLLEGHVRDFHEYTLSILGPTGFYPPTTYIVFALWSIPLHLLGRVGAVDVHAPLVGEVMWLKLLPTLFYLACALVVHQIAEHLGLGARRSRTLTLVWLTTPIAFFSQFIVGQYDALGLFFVLWGLLLYFRGNLTAFALLCGVAFTFKYFPILIFVPLLLLREKRIPQIFLKGSLFLLPMLLVILPYLASPVFESGMFGYQVASYGWGPSIWNGYVHLHLVLVGWMVACAWAYFVEPEGRLGLANWAFFFANLSVFLLFGLALFHPQWILFATPFWVLSSFMNRRLCTFLALDIVMMLFFVAFAASFHGIGEDLFALGVLKGLAVPVLGNTVDLKRLLLSPDASMVYSAFSALMLIQAVFKHPRFCAEQPNRTPLPSPALMRTRFLGGIAIFVVPAFLSLFTGLAARPAFFSTVDGEYAAIGPIGASAQLQQPFVARRSFLTRLDFMPAAIPGHALADVTIQLEDPETGKILFTKDVAGTDMRDADLYIVRLPFTYLRIGHEYVIRFKPGSVDPGRQLTFYRTALSPPDPQQAAVVDGQRQPFALVVRLFGY